MADGDGKEIERHLVNKGLHEANLEKQEQADLEHTSKETPPHLVLNDVCVAYVERNAMGKLYKSWACKDASHREEGKLEEDQRRAENQQRYKEIAEKTKELCDLMPCGKGARKGPVILDADGAVPYEHIVGILNACKEKGIENIEFVASPRHEGTFDTYRKDKK